MILLLVLLLSFSVVWALPPLCASEGGLQARTDVIHCEPWETATWWQNGYEENGSKSKVYPALSGDQTQVVSAGCISGNCLQVNIRSWKNGGGGGALAHHWRIPARPQEVFLRYYMKLAANFSPTIYSIKDGSNQGSGGKFPGLGDTRAYPDTFKDPLSGKIYNQCGNGGATADGINCWSARANYHGCTGSGGANLCQPGAYTRYGFYWYAPNNADPTHPLNTNQAPGLWDNQPWATAQGPCSRIEGLGNWNNSATGCGKPGPVGLVNDRWYLFEWQIKMNTPGVADGIARGWLDGVLRYEKTNLLLRNVGHDDLHVRTVWLNVHSGGELVGPMDDTAVYLDQLVVAAAARPGPWMPSSAQRPSAPSSLQIQ